MLSSIKGLVVRVRDLTGSDKLLTLFTPERGLLTVISKGSRSLKSRYLAASQLFCYGSYILASRGEYNYVREVELIESFYDLRLDIVDTALASYVCDVAADAAVAEQPDPEFLQLTLNTLYAIANHKYPLAHIKAAFELRTAAVLGFLPELSGCTACGRAEGDAYLDVMNGGLICTECRAETQKLLPMDEDDFSARTRQILCLLPPAAQAAMRYVTACAPERVFSFRLEEADMRYFTKATEEYLLNHLERGFQTLQFYKEVARGDL